MGNMFNKIKILKNQYLTKVLNSGGSRVSGGWNHPFLTINVFELGHAVGTPFQKGPVVDI